MSENNIDNKVIEDNLKDIEEVVSEKSSNESKENKEQLNELDDSQNTENIDEKDSKNDESKVKIDVEKEKQKLTEKYSGQEGKWYVVRVFSGKENIAKANLESRIKSLNMEKFIYEVDYPIESTVVVKNKEAKIENKKLSPGYLFIRMEMNDDSWAAVSNTPDIYGFVGKTKPPTPIEVEDIVKMFLTAIVSKETAQEELKELQKVEVVEDYKKGDIIRVSDGPFSGIPGTISEVNNTTKTLKVFVTIFGRETPIDLNFFASNERK